MLSGAGLASTLVARIGATGPASLDAITPAVWRDLSTSVPPDTYIPPGAQCLSSDYECSVTGCTDMKRAVTYSWKASMAYSRIAWHIRE